MNIYEKLQTCRVELQKMNLKKSGENKFAGYDYFELCDFLPQVNELFLKYKLFSQVSFTSDIATLTIVDAEKPEDTIIFTSPMASATLKGCHDIQNLGAVESYQRRYLYLTALEIVESDALEPTTGKDDKQPKNKQKSEQDKPGNVLCDDCGSPVNSNVALFCQKNSERFKGKIVCPKCQKQYK
jgi:hypothetical protein